MSSEKPSSKSEGFGLSEEWVALEMIGDITMLPVDILSDLVEFSFEL